MTDTSTATKPDEKTWFGHPRPLAVLFSTEMWERFGYYGMRAVLILYLVKHFVFADRVGSGLYGAFTSLVYLTPLVGGYIADRYFGSKKAVKFGAILMSAGYLMLAFTGGPQAKPFVTINGHHYDLQVVETGDTTTQYVIDGAYRHKITGNPDKSISLDGTTGALPSKVAAANYRFDAERPALPIIMLFVSLGLIVVGNGYFKPNISTIVGTLYPEGDRRRDSGFTIFYMGINLGSIISQTLVPLIAVKWGYQWGFAFAGIGMLLAWMRIQFSSKMLAEYGNPPPGAGNRDFIIIVLSLLAVPVAWFLLNNAMVAAQAADTAGAATGILGYLKSQPLLGQIMFVVFIGAMAGIPLWSAFSLPPVDRNRMIVAVVLTFFSVVFWTLFEQAGSSLTLFADRNTDLFLGNLPFIGPYTMPAGQVQIFNPLFIVIFAALFSIMWNWLGARGLEPSVPVKFSIGLLLVGLGFLTLVFGAKFHDVAFRVPLFWLAAAYFLHSIGELCLSPVGLSMISKLSVPRLVGMMMGLWFLSSSVAQYVGGIIAQFASTETVAGQVLNPEVSLNTYLGVFQQIGIAGIVSGVVLLILSPFLKRGMHGIN